MFFFVVSIRSEHRALWKQPGTVQFECFSSCRGHYWMAHASRNLHQLCIRLLFSVDLWITSEYSFKSMKAKPNLIKGVHILVGRLDCYLPASAWGYAQTWTVLLSPFLCSSGLSARRTQKLLFLRPSTCIPVGSIVAKCKLYGSQCSFCCVLGLNPESVIFNEIDLSPLFPSTQGSADVRETPSYLHQHFRAALQMGGHQPVAPFSQMLHLPSALI